MLLLLLHARRKLTVQDSKFLEHHPAPHPAKAERKKLEAAVGERAWPRSESQRKRESWHWDSGQGVTKSEF